MFSLVVFTISALFFSFSAELPNPSKLMDRDVAQSTKIYDRNNQLLYEVHGDIQRTLVTIDDIPQHLKDAVITTEDRDFYQHIGFDPKRFLGAVVKNLLNRDVYGQGASTITQQLIKNTVLTSEKTYTRKIKELILSIELEQILTKNEILQIYLNEIPFGSTAYGVQAASEIYFDKDIQDLTIAEGAVLAAIIQAPSYYSPYGNHTDELSERHHWILNQMRELEYIDEQQLTEALAEQIQFKRRNEDIQAPHFVFYVLEQLEQKYTQQEIEEGGLNIVTTLDLEKQNKAQELVTNYANKNASAYNAHNAALISIDPHTNQIIAMVGSKNYWDTENDGNVNVATSKRQPGSSYKPIIYAIGFMDKWFPGSTLYDLKTDFGGGYTPDNYDKSFRGPVSVRTALQNSLNIPAVKMLALVGLEKAIKISNDLGIKSLNDPDRYGLSLVLGGGEVKLIELTNAYAALANQGKYHDPVYIIKITDYQNNTIEEWSEEDKKKEEKEVFSPQIAYLMSNVLSDNIARTPSFGSNSNLYLGDRPVAAKTGTTDEYRDGWTLGYTPSLVTGVWAGNNDNTPMYNAPGIYVAAPLWNEYMRFALEGTEIEEFVKPEGIESVSVDKYSNLKPVEGSPVSTDIGASWHHPGESPQGVTTYRVCKANGKLADSDIPADLTEAKTYRVIHSEMPDNPAWETPVQSWAASANISAPPPEEKCSLVDIKPTISITFPSNNSTVNSILNISTSANAPSGVSSVEFFFDGSSIGSANQEPYSMSYDVSSKPDGQHFVSVNLQDNSGLSASDSININLSNQPDTSAPSVNFQSPANGASIPSSGFPYSLQVQASDNQTGVSRVDFKINSIPSGSVNTPTGSNIYTVTWTYPGNGVYNLQAVAYDNAGNTNTVSINVTVQ
ncbi:PBP1A family penicillin-binding protein [Patescibacteria group bacterium]|nr:PBP1A family penicillin-binding protein [Patescibacteria group bacterium]